MSHAIDQSITIEQSTQINDKQLQSLIIAFTDVDKAIYSKIKVLQQIQQLLQGQLQYVSRTFIYTLYKYLVEFLNEEENLQLVEQKKTFDPQALYDLFTYISNEQLKELIELHMAFNTRTYLLQTICVQATVNLLVDHDIIQQFNVLTDYKDDFKPLHEQQLFYLILTGNLNQQFIEYIIQKHLMFYYNSISGTSKVFIRHQDALQYTILNNKIHDALQFDSLQKQDLFYVINAYTPEYVAKIFHSIKKLVKKIPEQFIYLSFYILTLIERQDVQSLQLLCQLIYNNDKHQYSIIYKPLFQLSCEIIHNIKIIGELRPIISIPELHTTIQIETSNQNIINIEQEKIEHQNDEQRQQYQHTSIKSVKDVLESLKLLNLKYAQFPDIFWYFIMNHIEGKKSTDELKKFVRFFRQYIHSCEYLEYHDYIIYQPGKQFDSLINNIESTAQQLITYILTGANTFKIKVPDLSVEHFIEMCTMFQPTKKQLHELQDKELFPRGNNIFNPEKQLDQHINSILLGTVPTQKQIAQISEEINDMSRSCFNISGQIKSIRSAAKYIFIDQFIQQYEKKSTLSHFLKHSGTSSIYYFYYKWVILSDPFSCLLTRLNHISIDPQIFDQYAVVAQLSKNYITKFLQFPEELATKKFNNKVFNYLFQNKQYNKINEHLIKQMIVFNSDITAINVLQITPIKQLLYENRSQLHSQLVRNAINELLRGLIEQLLQDHQNLSEQSEFQIAFIFLLLSFFDDDKEFITEDTINEILSINEDDIDPLKLLLLIQVLSFVNQLFKNQYMPPEIQQKLSIAEKCFTCENVIQVMSITARLKSSQYYLVQFILQEFKQCPVNIEKIICSLGPDYLHFIEINLEYFKNNEYECLQLLNAYYQHSGNAQYDCLWMKPISVEVLQSLYLNKNVLINSDIHFLKELNMIDMGTLCNNLENVALLSQQQKSCLAFLISEGVQTVLNNPYNHTIDDNQDNSYMIYERKLNNISFRIIYNEKLSANAVSLLYDYKYYIQAYLIVIKSRSTQIDDNIYQELYFKYNILLYNKNNLITNDLNQQYEFSMRNSNNYLANNIRSYLIGTQNAKQINSSIKWRIDTKLNNNIISQYTTNDKNRKETNFQSKKITSCCFYDDLMSGLQNTTSYNVKIFYSILYNNLVLDFTKNINITIAMLVSFQVKKQNLSLQLYEIINYKRLMQFCEFELIASAIKYNNQLMNIQKLYEQDKMKLTGSTEQHMTQEQIVHACQMCIQQARMFSSKDYEQSQTFASQEQGKAAKILKPDKLLYSRLLNFTNVFSKFVHHNEIDLNDLSGVQLIRQLCTLNNNYYLFYEIITNPPEIKLMKIQNNNYLNILIYIKENQDLFYTNLIQLVIYLLQSQINTFTIRLGYHLQMKIQDYFYCNGTQLNQIQDHLIISHAQNQNIVESFCHNMLEALVRKTSTTNQEIGFNVPFAHPYHQNRMVSKIKLLQIPTCVNLVIIYEYYYYYQTAHTQCKTTLYQQQLSSQIEIFKVSQEDMLQAHIQQLTSEIINQNIRNSYLYDGIDDSIEQIHHYELMKIDQIKQKDMYKLIKFVYQRYNKQIYNENESINVFLIEYKNIISIKQILEDTQISIDLQNQVQKLSGDAVIDNPINYIVYCVKKSHTNYHLYKKLQLSYLLDTIIMRYPFSFQYQLNHFQNQILFSCFLQAILGIGDRHLTNMAIIFDVYPKICNLDAEKSLFKGLLQQIPETVPFRFTPLFQNCFQTVNQFKQVCMVLHKTLTSPYHININDFIVNNQLFAYLGELLNDSRAMARLTDEAVSDEGLSQMYYGWAAPL